MKLKLSTWLQGMVCPYANRNSHSGIRNGIRQLLLVFLLCPLLTTAQQTRLSCSMDLVPFVNGGTAAFDNLTVTSTVGDWTGTEGYLIDADLNNFAATTYVLGLGVERWIAVKDPAHVYHAGNFAGFVTGTGLLNLSVGGGLTVSTYLAGALQQSFSSSSLVSLSLGSETSLIGFYTDAPYDEIRLTINPGVLSVLTTYVVYYPVMRGTGSCSSPALACNADARFAFPTYAAVINPAHTGVTGALTVGAVSDTENLLDSDPNNYASITTTVSLLGSASIAVKDVATLYPAGTYAGFEISNPTLLDLNVLGNISVNTYKDGAFRETAPAASLLVGAPLLTGNDRFKIGFVTTMDFDEVQLVVAQTAGINLGTTRVYSVILKEFCEGPPLACNTPSLLNETEQPVMVNMQRTGFSGVACVGCAISGIGNLLDANPATYATINLVAGALGTGSLSVKNQLADYAAGTFAGFNLANPSLLGVDVLNSITVNTFLDGALVESQTGGGLIAGVPTSLIGGTNRMDVGFVATQPFDEVQLSLNNTVGLDLGATQVYGPVLERFCGDPLVCNSGYWLTSPEQPVLLNNQRTGVDGVLCALCAVTEPQAVLTADLTDFATLTNVAGVAAAPSLSVQDALRTYPAGTIAGYYVRKGSGLLDVSLLNAVTINTYLDGTLQESFSGAGQLLELTALLPLLSVTAGDGADYGNVGFMATLPFNEIQISNGALLGVANTLEVYGAFVDTRYATEVAPGVPCPREPLALADHSGTPQGVTLNGNVSWNDRNPDGTELTYTTAPVVAPLFGMVTLGGDGSFSYVPDPDYTGRDSFAYEVCNLDGLCATAWAYLSVLPPVNSTPENQPPQPKTDFSETPAGTAVTGHAAANDVDPEGDNLTYSLLTPPKRGTLSVAADGTYTYTPDPGLVGADTAVLQACDNGSPALCDVSWVVVFVYPAPPAAEPYSPFAQNDVYATPVGTPVTGNVLENDTEPENNPLSTSLLLEPEAAEGTLVFNTDGTFEFTPAPDFEGGTVNLAYEACSANGCDTATLALVVNPMYFPLPVRILSFTGKMQDCEAQLQWKAVADENFDRFELERCVDGSTFTAVGAIPAREAHVAQDFRFSVHQKEGTVLYRLKLVEKDGSAAYSQVLRLNSQCNAPSLVQVYPNPTSGWVKVSGLEAGSVLTLYDVQGRLMLQEQVTDAQIELNLTGLAPGMYQLVIDGNQRQAISLSLR